MRIWVAAGGTGGHLFPALAVIEEMERRLPRLETRFAISRRGLEEKVLTADGRSFTALSTEGFHRREVGRNLLFPVTLIAGLVQSLREVIRFRPNVAFGTGGFVSGPALLAARMAGVPVALLALDAMPGVTIRLLAPLATRVFIAHEAARNTVGRRRKVTCTGTPSRPVVRLDPTEARALMGLPPGGVCLFVTGGSQGSKALNGAVRESLDVLLARSDLSILWQTGPHEFESIRELVDALPGGGQGGGRGRVVVQPFIEEMNAAWSAADLALCRSGASTIAELSAHGVASLLVPLPTSAAGHQEANARSMSEAGAAVLLPEADLSPERLAAEVNGLADDPGRREAMSAAVSRFAKSDAALTIAGELVGMARGIGDRERERMAGLFGGVGS
jgi:UDP-N-acetylglucosamine--N-acetylmuramyl-(pentapeptide) pyrophosphoryl-undecaprenol N-acetylglucosamine transferase